MEFLLVYPDRSAIGHAPFFGSSVAEAPVLPPPGSPRRWGLGC